MVGRPRVPGHFDRVHLLEDVRVEVELADTAVVAGGEQPRWVETVERERVDGRAVHVVGAHAVVLVLDGVHVPETCPSARSPCFSCGFHGVSHLGFLCESKLYLSVCLIWNGMGSINTRPIQPVQDQMVLSLSEKILMDSLLEK